MRHPTLAASWLAEQAYGTPAGVSTVSWAVDVTVCCRLGSCQSTYEVLGMHVLKAGHWHHALHFTSATGAFIGLVTLYWGCLVSFSIEGGPVIQYPAALHVQCSSFAAA